MTKTRPKIYKSFRSYFQDPRKKLERLFILTLIFISYSFLYIYQELLNLEIKYVTFEVLVRIPVITMIIIPCVRLVIVKADPLQRSPSRIKAIRFFQKELPSRYLLMRCEKCIENNKTCKNYIIEDSHDHIRYWFYHILHGPIEQEDPQRVKDTFEKGYTCKLISYLIPCLLIFILLSISTLIIHNIYTFSSNPDQFKFQPDFLHIAFPLICLSILVIIWILHNPDDKKPSGCWQAWRQINRIHVGWLREHEDLLKNLICRANGNNKEFIEKT